MPVAWYLAPVAIRQTDRRPERYCPVDDELSARGIWAAGEVLGGYYVVRANGTAGQLDAVDAVAGVEVLPRAATLTTRLATLTAAQRNRLLALANNLGYTAQEISDWRAQVGDAVITLFHLFEFLAQRRRRPRWDDVAKQIVLDGPLDPVFKPWIIGGGAFPTTSVIDAFTRADAANLGSNWTGMLFPRFFGSELKIVSNTARPAAVDYCDDWYNVATYGGDCEAYVTITTLPSTEGNQVRVDTRIASPGSSSVDCYEALIVIHTAGNEDTRLYRIDNDTATQLGATDTTLNWASGDALGMDCVGTTITLYRKPSGGSWGSVISRTDSTYSAAGYIGCGVYQTGTLDDFGGGTISSGASTDAGRSVLTLNASGADVAGFVDAGRSVLTLNASGADIGAGVDAGRSIVGFSVGGADVFIGVDAGRSVIEMTAGGADIGAAVDVGRSILGMTAAADDIYAGVDAGRSVLDLDAAGADTYAGVEDGRSVIGFVVSGADSTGGDVNIDAGRSVVGMVATGAEAFIGVDTAYALFALVTSATDIPIFDDAGRSVFELMASADSSEGNQGMAPRGQAVQERAGVVGQSSASVSGRGRKTL